MDVGVSPSRAMAQHTDTSKAYTLLVNYRATRDGCALSSILLISGVSNRCMALCIRWSLEGDL